MPSRKPAMPRDYIRFLSTLKELSIRRPDKKRLHSAYLILGLHAVLRAIHLGLEINRFNLGSKAVVMGFSGMISLVVQNVVKRVDDTFLPDSVFVQRQFQSKRLVKDIFEFLFWDNPGNIPKTIRYGNLNHESQSSLLTKLDIAESRHQAATFSASLLFSCLIEWCLYGYQDGNLSEDNRLLKLCIALLVVIKLADTLLNIAEKIDDALINPNIRYDRREQTNDALKRFFATTNITQPFFRNKENQNRLIIEDYTEVEIETTKHYLR